MRYSLKMEVDGWGLALVIQELIAETKRVEWALNDERDLKRVVSLLNLRGDILGALEAFAGHLPAGSDEEYVLRMSLSEGQLDALVGALRMAVSREGGRADPRTEAVRALHDQVVGYLDAVDAARRASGR